MEINRDVDLNMITHECQIAMEVLYNQNYKERVQNEISSMVYPTKSIIKGHLKDRNLFANTRCVQKFQKFVRANKNTFKSFADRSCADRSESGPLKEYMPKSKTKNRRMKSCEFGSIDSSFSIPKKWAHPLTASAKPIIGTISPVGVIRSAKSKIVQRHF